MKKLKTATAFLLCALILIGIMPVSVFAAEKSSAVADWHFGEDGVKSGTLKKNDLVIADQTGNGNDLVINIGNADKYLAFSDEAMYGGTKGSMEFNNEKQRILGRGTEFITADYAPINKNSFENGYTIELLYKLPEDFAAEDSWMSLLARKGRSESGIEIKKCTMSLAVSNCKELQFMTVPADDDFSMDSVWSVTMDKGGLWYHIVVVSDGKTISTFVNGCESFRNYENEEMNGMYADPEDGRFLVGGYDNGVFDHRGRGNIQQIRISDRPLDKSEWLISDHENYLEKFGENLPFTNLSSLSYNMVFLPDIQNAAEFRPNVLNTAAKWLNDNKQLVNAVSFVSLGDSINRYNDQNQWDNALKFYEELEKGGYPILQQPGNHDYGGTYYLDTFGPESAFGIRRKERGVVYSPSGYSSYMVFDGGSYRYLVVSLSMAHIDDRDKEESAWFEQVLDEHKDYPTVLTSHSFLNVDAAKPNAVNTNDWGRTVWDIAKKHNQVFLMVSGHHHGAGEEVLLNDAGNEVYSVLTDYQFTYNGGNAFFRFAEFDEAHNKIRLSSFSPYAATLDDKDRTFFDVNYMTGAGNYTVIDFDFDSRFDGLRQSENYSTFRSALENAKKAEANAKTALFDGAAVIGKKDAHKVSKTADSIIPVRIIVIAAVLLAVVIAAAVITVVAVKKRKKVK